VALHDSRAKPAQIEWFTPHQSRRRGAPCPECASISIWRWAPRHFTQKEKAGPWQCDGEGNLLLFPAAKTSQPQHAKPCSSQEEAGGFGDGRSSTLKLEPIDKSAITGAEGSQIWPCCSRFAYRAPSAHPKGAVSRVPGRPAPSKRDQRPLLNVWPVKSPAVVYPESA